MMELAPSTILGRAWGGAESQRVLLGDVDDDGDLDAFIANQGANKVWLNNGTGNFIDSGQSLSWSRSVGLALGDVDGDGDLDAFVANYDGQANKVWLNDGTGAFVDSGQSLGNSNSHGVSLGDIDGDGDLDAFVANDNGQANKVWSNDGTGIFAEIQGLGNSDSTDVRLGDLDDDGDLDVFIANRGSNPANTVWLNRERADLVISKGVAPTAVAPGDAITYTLVYTNDSLQAATGVFVIDIVPTTLTDVGATSGGATITPTGSISYTWQVAPLAPGEGGIITITGIISSSGGGTFTLTNQATITATGTYTDTNPRNNTATVYSLVDASAPAVVTVAPGSGATNVALAAPVVVTFSEAIDAGSFAYSITPDPGGWSAVWSDGDTVVTLDHVPFAYQTTYTVTVTAATDAAGNPLAGAPYAWHFTTVSYRLYLPLVMK